MVRLGEVAAHRDARSGTGTGHALESQLRAEGKVTSEATNQVPPSYWAARLAPSTPLKVNLPAAVRNIVPALLHLPARGNHGFHRLRVVVRMVVRQARISLVQSATVLMRSTVRPLRRPCSSPWTYPIRRISPPRATGFFSPFSVGIGVAVM